MSTRESIEIETLLIGLDGVSTSVLQPLFDADLLPNLQALFDRGVVGDLESQIPPWTPSAWPSLYTGVNPGKHGAFDFLAFDGYDWGLVNRTHVREHALWELLDHRDHSSVVVNVPVTDPPMEFDGALVPGYISPESPTCHPAGLLEELRAELGEYRIYAPTDVQGAEQIDWYRRLCEMRGEAFRYLATEYSPDFGFVQFQQTDTVFHERPEDDSAIRTVFETVDDEIGQILETCDPDTVLVASDHGIGPYEGYEFRVNEFLRDRDIVQTTEGEGGMPSWTALAREKNRETGRSLLPRLLQTAASFGLTSQRIHAVLSRLGLAGFVLRHISTDTARAASERVDFAASTAYMRSRTELGVRINRAGRDPDGIVSPAEFSSIRDDLIQELEAARTPDGELVFEEVSPSEDYFSGPYADDGVDIITIPTSFDHYLSASLRGEQFDEPSEPWNHKRTGIIAAAGEGVDTAATPDAAHLFDVAPTVLATLDVPPTTRMDGSPISAVDGPPAAEYAPFAAPAAEATDDEAIRDRLANLGYLDDTNEY